MPPASSSKPIPQIPPYGDTAIEVDRLHFAYRGADSGSIYDPNHPDNVVLQDLNLTLRKGSRCLLIGANGSGKSTLLRILAGRHLTHSKVRVLGLDAYHDSRLNFHRAYLDCDWGIKTVAFVGSSPLTADVAVADMMVKLQEAHPERREELLMMLGIDLKWRMHQLSDGQRRRVQIFLGLLRPFQVLMLDEVTTSLDVCVRQDLLRWLVRESEERGATILYATHIFDGLDDWGTHLYYLTDAGACGWQGEMADLELYNKLKEEKHPSKMLAIAEHWLRKELDEKRRKREFERAAGARAHEIDATDRSQGGYASGRLETDEERHNRLIRHGRISDMMGNAGVMDKVRRVVEEPGK